MICDVCECEIERDEIYYHFPGRVLACESCAEEARGIYDPDCYYYEEEAED